MVFAAFTQLCIKSNVTHVRGVKYFTEQKIKKAMLEVLKVYSVYRGLSLCQEGRPVQPSVLWV